MLTSTATCARLLVTGIIVNMSNQVVPNKTEMKHYLSRGMTQQQIADAWGEKTGTRPSRSAIGMALVRYGLKASKPRPRYEELLPWRVRAEHKMHYDARMLRLEGRVRAGKPVSQDLLDDLVAWKQRLAELDAVVHYEPDTEEGFWFVKREPQDDDIIRKPKD